MQLGEKTGFRILSILLVLLCVGVCVYVCVCYPKPADSGDVDFTSGWKTVSHPNEYISFPFVERDFKGREIAITNTLPQTSDNNLLLYIKTDYRKVSVHFAKTNTSVQVIENHAFNLEYSNDWAAISVPEEALGGEISITLGAKGSKAHTSVYDILLGQKADINYELLSRSSVAMIICAVSVVIFILNVAAIWLTAKSGSPLFSTRYVYLAFFVLFSCAWVFLDSDVSAVLFVNSPTLLLAVLTSYLLLPLPFIFFFEYEIKSSSNFVKLLFAAHASNIAVDFLLLFLGAFSIETALSVSHLILCVTIISCVTLAALEFCRTRDRALVPLLVSLAMVCTFGVLEMARFYLEDNPYYTAYFRVGLFLFCLVETVDTTRKSLAAAKFARGIKELSAGLPAGIARISPDLEVLFCNDAFRSTFDMYHSGSMSLNELIDEESVAVLAQKLSSIDATSFNIDLNPISIMPGNQPSVRGIFKRESDGSLMVVTALFYRANTGAASNDESPARKGFLRYDVADGSASFYGIANNVFSLPEAMPNFEDYIITERNAICRGSVKEFTDMMADIKSGRQRNEGTMLFCNCPSGKRVGVECHYTLAFDDEGLPLSAYITLELRSRTRDYDVQKAQ